MWYALRGGHLLETLWRGVVFFREMIFMVLPYYSIRYGRIESLRYTDLGNIEVEVRPATKYGTLFLGGLENIVVKTLK